MAEHHPDAHSATATHAARASTSDNQHAQQVDLDAYFNHQRQVEYYCYNQQFHRKPAQVCMSPQQAQFLFVGLDCLHSSTKTAWIVCECDETDLEIQRTPSRQLFKKGFFKHPGGRASCRPRLFPQQQQQQQRRSQLAGAAAPQPPLGATAFMSHCARIMNIACIQPPLCEHYVVDIVLDESSWLMLAEWMRQPSALLLQAANSPPPPVQVCPPATREDIQRFQAAMTVCFHRAVDAGLSIAVSPRLDDGLGIGGWRNGEQPALPITDLVL